MLRIFLSKIPESIEEFHPRHKKLFTFVNPYSYLIAEKNLISFREFDSIAPDGILVVYLLNLFRAKPFKVQRFSFDMTSLVPYIAKIAVHESYTLFFIGTQPSYISGAIENLQNLFPSLNIIGFRHGYFKSNYERHLTISNIIKLNPDIVIIGMGTPLQENMAISLKKAGYLGSIYTCGGFLHQTYYNAEFYPDLINRFNLRLPYRWIKEKGVFIRSLKSYPIFCLKFPFLLLRNKFQ